MTQTQTTKTQPRLFTRELRVSLTESEITDRGRKLAARRADRAQLDEKRKAVAKDYGGQIAQIDAELDSLQGAIQAGSELRPVQCYEQWEAGVVKVRRADTDEVIDTRVPTISEQQTDWIDSVAGDSESGSGMDLGGDAGGDAGDVEDQDDDFGGAKARGAGAPRLEVVTSSTGGTVAHMPDEDGDGEAPRADLGDLAPPAKGKGKGKPGKKRGK